MGEPRAGLPSNADRAALAKILTAIDECESCKVIDVAVSMLLRIANCNNDLVRGADPTSVDLERHGVTDDGGNEDIELIHSHEGRRHSGEEHLRRNATNQNHWRHTRVADQVPGGHPVGKVRRDRAETSGENHEVIARARCVRPDAWERSFGSSKRTIRIDGDRLPNTPLEAEDAG